MTDYGLYKEAFKRGLLQTKMGRKAQAAALIEARKINPELARLVDVNKSPTWRKIEPKVRPITERYPAAPEAWLAGNVVGVGLPGSGTAGIGAYVAGVEAKRAAKSITRKLKGAKGRMVKKAAEATTVPKTDLKAPLPRKGVPAGQKFITTPEESRDISQYFVSSAKPKGTI